MLEGVGSLQEHGPILPETREDAAGGAVSEFGKFHDVSFHDDVRTAGVVESALAVGSDRSHRSAAAVSSTPSARSSTNPNNGSGEKEMPPTAGKRKESSRWTKSHWPPGA